MNGNDLDVTTLPKILGKKGCPPAQGDGMSSKATGRMHKPHPKPAAEHEAAFGGKYQQHPAHKGKRNGMGY
jgi:hypothetical protein